MARKVPLPVKISQELLERVDQAAETMSKRAGVKVDRTAVVEKALGDLCSYVEDQAARERFPEAR